MKLIMLLTLVSMGLEASAVGTNSFIPNHYRNRRALNLFSAIAWSDRKEVGVQFERENSKEATNGVDTDETKTSSLQAQTFYRVSPNLNMEGVLSHSKFETDNKGFFTNTEGDANSIGLGVGYEVPEKQMGVSALIQHVAGESSTTGGTSTDTNLDLIALGFGYRLPENVYLGFGYTHFEYDFGPGFDGADDGYYFGVGQVSGDAKSPDTAVEGILNYSNEDGVKTYGLTLKGLMNRDALQYYGEIANSSESGDDKDKITSFAVGVDFQFAQFYIGPEFGYEIEQEKNPDVDDKTSTLSLEGGYRAGQIEVFLRLGTDKAERDFENSPTSNSEENDRTVALGGSYKF